VPGVVHLVDDDASFRTAIERRLTLAGYRVATYPSAQQLLECPPNENEPACILLDVQMPGLGGLEFQRWLNARGSTLPIVFLTGFADTPTTVRAIKAGAEDFLTKPVESEQLLGAVERALARHAIVRGEQLRLQEIRILAAGLTAREREVFALVVRGKLNKQIAFELGTTERTIKAHRHQVMEKMKARSLAELVRMAERLGVLGQRN
jgi:FixJ family two-component response regulator